MGKAYAYSRRGIRKGLPLGVRRGTVVDMSDTKQNDTKRQFRAPDTLWDEMVRLDTKLAELRCIKPNSNERVRQAIILHLEWMRDEIKRLEATR